MPQQFLVPLFIETESLIFGPLNALQSLIMGIAGGAVLMILLSTKNIFLTFVAAIIFGGPASFLALGKINGEKIPKIIALALKFLISQKVSLWQKKGKEGLSLREIKRIIEEKEKVTKTFQESRLKKVAWEIETGKR